jgi:hypothetical protein
VTTLYYIKDSLKPELCPHSIITFISKETCSTLKDNILPNELVSESQIQSGSVKLVHVNIFMYSGFFSRIFWNMTHGIGNFSDVLLEIGENLHDINFAVIK